jgi:energy-coupling factor transport system ATP-binding protein
VRERAAPFVFLGATMSQDVENPIKIPDTNEAVRGANIRFSYTRQDATPVQALTGVSLMILKGEHVVLIGRNGSGKSTLAKLINVLEVPDEGTLMVLGLDTLAEENFWYIRSHCGMVFQNPDNQIVGTSVEEDVAFGPENLGIPTAEIRKRVDDALEYVGLKEFADRMPSSLSGGQKQKLAIAGVLAMMPQVLILDESTAMLDPISRNEFLDLVERLRIDKGITVIHITHDMSEAYRAGHVFVLEKGGIVMDGAPSDVFIQHERMAELGLDVPVFAGVVLALCKQLGIDPRKEYLESRDTALDAVRSILASVRGRQTALSESVKPAEKNFAVDLRDTVLQVKNLSYSYEERNGMTLQDISFSVKKGEVYSVIGHSGSGKTTLISHLNGLIRPQKGEVELFDPGNGTVWNTRKNADVKEIRKRIGLLFQYPEYQLFEETVRKDILFGPLKMGMDKADAEKSLMDAIHLVGLDESYLERSPFELSGGQKRRVAFAGVIAMNPEILVLDEPAAGLDPAGRRDVFRYIRDLKNLGKTIILVSHNMDEAARISDRLLVLTNGRAIFEDTPDELFSSREKVTNIGLDLPESVMFLRELAPDFPGLNLSVYDVEQAAAELINAARGVSGRLDTHSSIGTSAEESSREVRDD